MCLNDKIYFVNRISRVFYLDNNKYNYIQLEVIIKNIESEKFFQRTLKEIPKVFKIQSLKVIGIKHSRITYTPSKLWYKKATKVCKDFVKIKTLRLITIFLIH